MTWESAWEEERTPWDAGKSPPILRDLVQNDALPTGRALVTGAGSGYDVLTLASAERHVVGVDLSTVARERFASLRAGHPHEAQAQFVVGNFFELSFEEPFDMAWDYTFLCALEPSMRTQWAQTMHRLLHPEHGELIALIFPVVPDADPNEGPPYPMTEVLVRELLDPYFACASVEPVLQSHPRREGKEYLGRFRRRG